MSVEDQINLFAIKAKDVPDSILTLYFGTLAINPMGTEEHDEEISREKTKVKPRNPFERPKNFFLLNQPYASSNSPQKK